MQQLPDWYKNKYDGVVTGKHHSGLDTENLYVTTEGDTNHYFNPNYYRIVDENSRVTGGVVSGQRT